MFYVPAFWEQHGYKVIAAIVIGFILLILSLLLNLQWIRRRRAEEETKHQRTALAHVARLGSVGELTASIVHEINQPLGAILTNADAATMMLKQHSSTDEELTAILDDIREDNLRASRIIQKLRTLLSKRSLESVALSLNDVITSCRSLLGNMAIRHHAILLIDLADNLPSVMGDNTHLQQVLINLVSNGMEAMSGLPPPERRLTVTTRSVGNTVQLIVANNGPAIPPSVLTHMFESFYTTKPDGMGMGLAIVQTIVDVHSGSIEVQNGEHDGSVFKITLPSIASTK
jgi:C4-dicarboxylate-specific signal transduction histidine kinase